MEKLRREWVDNGVLHWEPVYSAADVDEYRQAVKSLVGAADDLIKLAEKNYGIIAATLIGPVKRGKKAIAAVERLEVE